MVEGKFRSRSLRRVKVKTPSSKVVVHYRKRTPKAARCTFTGEVLMGVPRARPAKMKNLAKTKKRPQRPFGGVLSSRAMRALMIEKAREE